MNIGVFTFYTPSFQAVADITLPNIREYCELQDYHLTVHCGGFGCRSPLGLQKTAMVHGLLSGFDALFVIDIDVLITNHTIRLETFLDFQHTIFVAHDDTHGLNAGSYLIRSERGSELLLSVLQEPLLPGECEQDGMRKVLARSPQLCKVLPHPSINSYLYAEYGRIRTHEEGQWEPGDFILHLPGRTNERRIELFTSPEIQGALK